MEQQQHKFLFEPGVWIGEGKVSFSASPEQIRFFTRWEIEKSSEDGCIHCKQTVEMQGIDDQVVNSMVLSAIHAASFELQLENDLLNTAQGKGIIDGNKIAWEYRGHESFEGFEVYDRQENGEYAVHAEYASSPPDQFRTIIDGRIWEKAK